MDKLWNAAQLPSPPTVDNVLINGTNVFGEDGKSQIGRRFGIAFTSGKSYRLGNAACDTHFKFSIDHHKLTAIEARLMSIQPY